MKLTPFPATAPESPKWDHADPRRDAYWRRYSAAVMIWWETRGIKLYAWGLGTKEGDKDELVHKYCDHPTKKTLVYGLWRRTPGVKGRRDIPRQVQMVELWIGRLIIAHHPEVKLPKMTASGWRNRPRQPRAARNAPPKVETECPNPC